MSGTDPMDLSDDDLNAVTGGNGLAAAAGITATNIQGMDLETAMMAVQSNRANLLEAQLKDQIASVQAKNDTIKDLNSALTGFNTLSNATPKDANASYRVTDSEGFAIQPNGARVPGMESFADLFKKSGITQFDHKDMTKGEVDSAIALVKGSIDSQSNSQQMDMLRLQSLSNKRNEAFDVMTNFIKKMQDSRSSIIGNMR